MDGELMKDALVYTAIAVVTIVVAIALLPYLMLYGLYCGARAGYR